MAREDSPVAAPQPEGRGVDHVDAKEAVEAIPPGPDIDDDLNDSADSFVSPARTGESSSG